MEIHLVSDSTGETLSAAHRAATSRFPTVELRRKSHVFVRSAAMVEDVLQSLPEKCAIVLHTIANPDLVAQLEKGCAERGIPAKAFLEPILGMISDLTEVEPLRRPGSQYRVDQSYLDRMSAIDYAMSHDDGLSPAHLLKANVILVGVSRTSKTPTCIYLGYQGIRAANVPLVPGSEPPEKLFKAIEAGVPAIGLIASPNRLVQVRKHRLMSLDQTTTPAYAELDQVREEVARARLFFERHALPVIDVTRRSIEETAAAVRAILEKQGANA